MRFLPGWVILRYLIGKMQPAYRNEVKITQFLLYHSSRLFFQKYFFASGVVWPNAGGKPECGVLAAKTVTSNTYEE
jgi:hypothetical protein